MKRPPSQFSTLALLWFRCLLAFLHLIPSSLFAWHRYFGVLERNTKTWWMRYADPQKECPGYNLLVKENQRLHTFWVDQYNGYEFPHRRPAWSFHKGGPLRFNTWSFFKINPSSFYKYTYIHIYTYQHMPRGAVMAPLREGVSKWRPFISKVFLNLFGVIWDIHFIFVIWGHRSNAFEFYFWHPRNGACQTCHLRVGWMRRGCENALG